VGAVVAADHSWRARGGRSADIAATLALRDQHHREVGRPPV